VSADKDVTIAHLDKKLDDALDKIERLRAALGKIAYLDSPQVRGLPRRRSIHDIARAALEAK
jgi:hypothetical protein